MDEIYENEGKGLVLENFGSAAVLANMFAKKRLWTSQELNDEIGWQFSQAVYTLRRRGLKIKTIRLQDKKFAYKLMDSDEE